MNIPDDPVTDALVKAYPPDDDASACPDPNDLAGLAEGRLLEHEAAQVRTHLASCAACREVVADLAPVEETVAAGDPVRARLPRWPGWAAAALILVAVGAAVVFGPGSGRDATTTAAQLAEAAPVLFADFTMLSPDELADPPTTTRRGGIEVLRPRGTVLEGRPVIEWKPVPGAREYTVQIASAGVLVGAAGTKIEWPSGRDPLAPGVHAVVIWTQGPLGRVESTHTFRVADQELVTRFETALDTIREIAPASERPLLVAHFAIRHELYAQAALALAAPWTPGEDRPLRDATQTWLDEVLGRSP